MSRALWTDGQANIARKSHRSCRFRSTPYSVFHETYDHRGPSCARCCLWRHSPSAFLFLWGISCTPSLGSQRIGRVRQPGRWAPAVYDLDASGVLAFPNKLNYDGSKVFKSFGIKTFLCWPSTSLVWFSQVMPTPPEFTKAAHHDWGLSWRLAVLPFIGIYLMATNKIPEPTTDRRIPSMSNFIDMKHFSLTIVLSFSFGQSLRNANTRSSLSPQQPCNGAKK